MKEKISQTNKFRKMNTRMNLTLLVVETPGRVATGQEQDKQTQGNFFSEFVYLIILSTEIRQKRVMREICITPRKA